MEDELAVNSLWKKRSTASCKVPASMWDPNFPPPFLGVLGVDGVTMVFKLEAERGLQVVERRGGLTGERSEVECTCWFTESQAAFFFFSSKV